MKFSKAWLQTYSKEALPQTQELAEVITFNAFEVEEIEEKNGDTIFDIKVLPNRAHDALAHRGMAKEICALTGTTFNDPEEYYEGTGDDEVIPPRITSVDTKACTRFMSARIEGVTVTKSPEWLRTRLESIGQKSINSIVDVTNYVQFSLNKPMHAYDATCIEGGELVARYAQEGETLTTLDDKEITLQKDTLVIADKNKPLALAGIKGGKSSGVSFTTTSLILESANFDSALIRKTSEHYSIKTDSSKRFENGISDTLVEDGLRLTIALIKKLNPNARVSALVDVGSKHVWEHVVACSTEEVNKVLGTTYQDEDIKKTLTQLGFTFTTMTLKESITKQIASLQESTYKNPSSMREDAPNSFSCSSLMSYLFLGVWQPSISIDKYVYAEKITQKDLQWGDLIFSNTGEGKIYYESVSFLPQTKVPEGIDHVGLYVGDGNVLHISQTHNTIVTEKIAESKQFQGSLLYGRVAPVSSTYFFVTVPPERLDIRRSIDLLEEIARVQGLSTIKGVLPVLGKKGLPHKRLFYEMKIKNILFTHGFSEMYTYTFGKEGDIEILKALSDKKKLRTSLARGVLEALTMNLHNAPLLGISVVKVFEFGNVFTKENESRKFALGIDDGKKKTSFTEEVELILSEIKRELGLTTLSYTTTSVKPYCIEIDFDEMIATLPEGEEYVPLLSELATRAEKTVYQAVSPYPFIVRDIAVWTPEGTSWEDIYTLAKTIDDKRIVRISCFDTFTKEYNGKPMTSFAFRFVIQSFEKTLTDEEANEIANKMYSLLKERGYEVR